MTDRPSTTSPRGDGTTEPLPFVPDVNQGVQQAEPNARDGVPKTISATLGRKIDVSTSTNTMTTLTLTVSVQPFSLEEAIRRANDLLEGRRPDDDVSTGD